MHALCLFPPSSSKDGPGAKSSPDFVPPLSVTQKRPCDIELCFLPYASGRHFDDVFLELLPGDGSFQRCQADPQRIDFGSASSSHPAWTCRFCSQSEVLTSLLAQDRRRHVVGSFLSSHPEG